MNMYLKVVLPVKSPIESERLMAELSEMGFYAFEETEDELIAYIREDDYSEQELLGLVPAEKVSSIEKIQEENWNAKWEEDFSPVYIGMFACIRAHFHEKPVHVLHDIVITPKMSFGTGHHATTKLMVQAMKEVNFTEKEVLDFGTGTGILAILAEKLGARRVTAVDYDEWSVENAGENVADNGCEQIEIYQSDSPMVAKSADIILANINLNVLSTFAGALSQMLSKGGFLIISGFLNTDEEEMTKTFAGFLLDVKQILREKGWSCMVLSGVAKKN